MRSILKILIPAILFCFSSVSAQYKIGIILPLTGENSSIGHSLKNGIDLAFKTLPAEQQAGIKLYYEDDQLQGNKAVASYHKLVSGDDVDAFIVLGSGDGNVIAPLAEADRKIMITIGASDTTIVRGRNFSFIHWIAPETEARVLAQEMKRRGYKHIAFITTDQQGALAVRDATATALEEMGIKDRLVMNDVILPGEKDFRSFIAKARGKQVDAILLILFPGSLSACAKETRRQKLPADLIGAEFFEDEDEVKASEGTLLGQWYVNADDSTGDFRKLFREAYNTNPGWGAPNAYDVLNLLAQGVLQYGKDNTKIVQFLQRVKDYPGASGKYSSTGDNRFDLPVAVKIVRENGFEKIR